MKITTSMQYEEIKSLLKNRGVFYEISTSILRNNSSPKETAAILFLKYNSSDSEKMTEADCNEIAHYLHKNYFYFFKNDNR